MIISFTETAVGLGKRTSNELYITCNLKKKKGGKDIMDITKSNKK